MKSVMSNMMAGVNELQKSDVIGDNQFSDCWDASIDETTNAIELHTYVSNPLAGSNATGSGRIINSICAKNASEVEMIFVLTKNDATGDDVYIDSLEMFNVTNNQKTTISIASHQLTYVYTSMCLFNLEATRYVCFTASGSKKLMCYDFTSVKAIAIPFYPKRIVPHYNRIFAIDTGNKIWWCRAGDLFTWYGLEEDDDKIVTLTNMLNSTAYTIAAQPDVPRPLSITVVKVSTIDTLGTLAVVGTDSLGVAQSKTYTPIDGKYISPDVWSSITSITATGHSAVGTVDTIKIGTGPVTGFVQDDAGYWTLEQEYELVDLVVLGGSLYIFSPINIYIFQGNSYDTFSLSKTVSNLGCLNSSEISSCGNIAYFWGTSSELYEYNGNDYPKIINKPVHINGSVSNNIYGSIGAFHATAKLAAITGKLYVYSTTSEGFGITVGEVTTVYYQLYVCEFDVRSRTWWKRAGFVSSGGTDEPTAFVPFYVPNVAKDQVNNLVYEKVGTANSTWSIFSYMGHSADDVSRVTTKAFNGGISEDMTLTNIIIYARYVKDGGPA
jgi:hypothetical protein